MKEPHQKNIIKQTALILESNITDEYILTRLLEIYNRWNTMITFDTVMNVIQYITDHPHEGGAIFIDEGMFAENLFAFFEAFQYIETGTQKNWSIAGLSVRYFNEPVAHQHVNGNMICMIEKPMHLSKLELFTMLHDNKS